MDARTLFVYSARMPSPAVRGGDVVLVSRGRHIGRSLYGRRRRPSLIRCCSGDLGLYPLALYNDGSGNADLA
jgi:hypothetical protein